MGHRIAKHVYDENFQLQKSTYYILDASGNVMATYDKEINYAESKTYFKLKERHIYGSSRVGVRNSDLDVLPLPDKDFSMTTVHYSIGSRTYELSNHLGNVLSVISDKVIPVFPYSNVISEMRADIRVAQDYSPFGVTLDGRNFVVNGGYRYGFQNQEVDNEVKGEGNSIDFGARMYDPRLGRWFSRDAFSSAYPSHSAYSYALNNPIVFKDKEGNFIVDGNGNIVKFTISKKGVITFEGEVDPFTKKIIETMASNSAAKDVLLQVRDHQGIKVQYKAMSSKLDELFKEENNMDAWGVTLSKRENDLLESFSNGNLSKEDYEKELKTLYDEQYTTQGGNVPEGQIVKMKDKKIFQDQVILINEDKIAVNFADPTKELLLTATEESIHSLQDYISMPTGDITQEEYENLGSEKVAKEYLKRVETEYDSKKNEPSKKP